MKQREIVHEIISELFAPSPDPAPDKYMPGWVRNRKTGEQLTVPRTMAKLIGKLSDAIYHCDRALQLSHSRSSFQNEVRSVLVQLLFDCSPEEPRDDAAARVLAELKQGLSARAYDGTVTFLFGCSLFAEAPPRPIKMGPVTFWPRMLWLDHGLSTGQLSAVTHRRLSAEWNGKKNKARKESRDADVENAVREAVGPTMFICSVDTCGLSGEVARSKAAMAARLGLAAVSLFWELPSKPLRYMNLLYDGTGHMRTSAFVLNGKPHSGGPEPVRKFIGQAAGQADWQAAQDAREKDRPFYAIEGEIISYLLSADGKVARPALMNAFAHALIWFHEACRDEMPMVAVTKFVASIDSLAQRSNGASGLINLVTARFGAQPNDPIRADAVSIKQALTDLYSEGRSQPLHGSSKRLGHDWEEDRTLAEAFARHALALCLDWAADNPDSDDPHAMARP